jgi:hypothetical protein
MHVDFIAEGTAADVTRAGHSRHTGSGSPTMIGRLHQSTDTG